MLSIAMVQVEGFIESLLSLVVFTETECTRQGGRCAWYLGLCVLHICNTYVYYIWILVYVILRCTIWDCDQQIPWYLAVLGLLQVQLQGRVMDQPQMLCRCILLHVFWVIYCSHIVYGVLCGFVYEQVKVSCSLGGRYRLGESENWLE